MDVLEDEEYTEDVEPAAEPDKKVLIISCSGDLERTWATLIIATTAAAMGMQTSIFFTFWGFFPLVRNDVRITGENWMQKMLSFMNRPGTDHLKLSKMNFAGAGPAMMRKIARDHKVALPTELLETARDMGVRLLPCQMSMDLLGLKREDLIEGVEDPVGATSMLLEAQGATTLFI
jgi:peroxiredoxin family protein